MTAKVFIDGEAGTTGLQIGARLAGRDDIELLHLDDAERKDTQRRREALNAADLVILCLPDEAAREAVALIDNPATRVIDASTAHRTADGWVYGFPEYDAGQREAIAGATRVANPGCYALASIAILHPLVEAGLLAPDWPVSINAVSGYTGGGKSLIAAFEDPASETYSETPYFAYGLDLAHKHVPEITRWSGLAHAPVFAPGVGRFAQGMIVQVPLALWAMPGSPSPSDVHAALADHYAGQWSVDVVPPEEAAATKRLEPEALNGTNRLALHVFANGDAGQAVVTGLLDNLGKGAAGQAVQNLNLMLGLPEKAGLE
jgi:N-acetyl-gamma-glutamyl-phosphate reductase